MGCLIIKKASASEEPGQKPFLYNAAVRRGSAVQLSDQGLIEGVIAHSCLDLVNHGGGLLLQLGLFYFFICNIFIDKLINMCG